MNGQNPELWCWWCCHPINETPLQLPKEYLEKKKTYVVYGYFCSFECMKTFNINENGSYKQNQTTLISKLIRETYGCHKDIKPAPPRQCLSVFGGSMNIQEFRGTKEKTFIVFTPPLVSHSFTIEPQNQTNYRWVNNVDDNHEKCLSLKEFEDSQTTKVSNIPMKIKSQNNPKMNTLEKILGMKSTTNEPKSS